MREANAIEGAVRMLCRRAQRHVPASRTVRGSHRYWWYSRIAEAADDGMFRTAQLLHRPSSGDDGT
jgi:hypothetical protein